MVKRLIGISLLLIFFQGFFFGKNVFAASWYYPLPDSLKRESYKTFGQYIDANFYLDKEKLFPARFTGFHAGSDLEIFPDEFNKKVPVYTISSGTITFFGRASGYGGVILEKLENTNLTVLYGHLNIKDINFRVGDRISGGERIAYLGEAFSQETGGERKHLHFAIYNGSDLYFKGYEETKEELNKKWTAPLKFLEGKMASDPKDITAKSIEEIKKPEQINSPNNFLTFFQKIITKITEIIPRFRLKIR